MRSARTRTTRRTSAPISHAGGNRCAAGIFRTSWEASTYEERGHRNRNANLALTNAARAQRRARAGTTVTLSLSRLLLAERLRDLILERAHEIRHDGAHRGLDEDLHRHAGLQLVLAEAREFGRGDRDTDGVVAHAG